MNTAQLETTARALVAEGKGILAADESFPTIGKRFKGIKIESTEENRQAYRDMLFTTKGAGRFISGVILFDETLRQKGVKGKPFPAVLKSQGIIPGIKVDTGAKPLAGYPEETITEGLDGLRERLAEYYKLGARFAKWRAVLKIGHGLPTRFCIDANAHALARYAALCQEVGLVPIVEPEVLMDGDHTIERCETVTETTLKSLYFHLHAHRVVLEGTLLKPNMVISGKDCPKRAGVSQVAEATIRTLKRCVPSSVPGIVFLSGGQTPKEATAHLSAMNAMGTHPWEVSFSYGRALQEPALDAWHGKKDQVAAGQKAFFHRSELNSAARSGRYTKDMESAA